MRKRARVFTSRACAQLFVRVCVYTARARAVIRVRGWAHTPTPLCVDMRECVYTYEFAQTIPHIWVYRPLSP